MNSRKPSLVAPNATTWPARLVKLLGKRPDAAVAKLAECSGESVRRHRLELGIPARRRQVAWTERQIAILRTLDGASNAEAARQLGRSEMSVRVMRSRLGLSPQRPSPA